MCLDVTESTQHALQSKSDNYTRHQTPENPRGCLPVNCTEEFLQWFVNKKSHPNLFQNCFQALHLDPHLFFGLNYTSQNCDSQENNQHPLL